MSGWKNLLLLLWQLLKLTLLKKYSIWFYILRVAQFLNPYHYLIDHTFLSLLQCIFASKLFNWSMFLCQSLRNFHSMILLGDIQIHWSSSSYSTMSTANMILYQHQNHKAMVFLLPARHSLRPQTTIASEVVQTGINHSYNHFSWTFTIICDLYLQGFHNDEWRKDILVFFYVLFCFFIIKDGTIVGIIWRNRSWKYNA